MRKMRHVIVCSVYSLLILLVSAPITPAQTVTVPDETVRWDGQSPFNVLVLGMDRRPGARDTLNVRTDVVMIARFDPVNQRVGILDIPRDIHMALLDRAEQLVRVNTLLVEGEAITTGYGPYFAMETLQLNLGMYIDGYIVFDFEAFTTFIDAIGGVTVNNPFLINDRAFPDMNYGFDPFYLTSGTHHLNGSDALRFARTRHGDNDYARGQRQLEVVAGVYRQLQDPIVLATLVRDLPPLIDTLDRNFYSNIAPDQLLLLGLSIMELPPNSLYMGSMNTDYSFTYIYRGAQVQVPDRNTMSELLVATFGEDYWR
jgi:polyisoprenyl-teichoic acid--peptidoglycan teichoic acid transferase